MWERGCGQDLRPRFASVRDDRDCDRVLVARQRWYRSLSTVFALDLLLGWPLLG